MTDTQTTTATPIAEWQRHQPIWGPPVEGEEHRKYSCHGCTRCILAREPEALTAATFAKHLKELGAPDYMVTYYDDWARHVERADGTIDRNAVARELFDFGVVMGEASKVYEELAGFSKPNTAAEHVIAGAEAKYNEIHADLLLHDLLPEIEDEAAKKAIIEYAEALYPGAWAQFEQSQATLARLLEGKDKD